MSRINVYLPEVKELISTRNEDELMDVLSELYPIEILEIYREIKDDDEKEYLLNKVSRGKLIDIFDNMEEDEQIEVLNKFPVKVKTLLLNEMAPDERADLFDELPKEQIDDYIKLVHDETKKEIDLLSKYPAETAGGRMTTEYAAVPEDLTISKAIKLLRKTASEKETLDYIYIIDKNKKLKGFISLRKLFLAPTDKIIKKIMNENVISVDAYMDQEEVADVIRKYDFTVVPVVDNNKLVGIVTVDDIIDVIREEHTEDMYKFGAVEPSKYSYMEIGILQLIKSRLPWLFVLATAGFISIQLIEKYSSFIENIVLLAAFFPILMGSSGNAGAQSAAIIIRGLATGDVESKKFLRILLKELIIGVLMGIFLGGYISLKAFLVNKNPSVGLIVVATMPLTVCLATTAGALLPIIFEKLGFDPANMSNPFITTITDITTLIIYFNITKYLIGF